jgi:hypothetical protein
MVDKTVTSWRPRVVQGIAQQESLYVSSLKENENKTEGWHDKDFWRSYVRTAKPPTHFHLINVGKQSEAECEEIKSEQSESKTML